jgi:sortase A
MVIFKSQVILSQIGYITNKTNTSAITTEAPAAVSAAPVISIPKINVNAPVVYEPSIAEAAIQKALQGGVAHYGTSVKPGQNGNMVIVGHSSNDWWEPGNYKFVFVLLDKLTVGDEFKINYQSRQYVYKVSQVKVVEPTDLSVLAPTPGPTATLITCTPPGTSWKRLVIKADQISPAPGVVTTPTTDNTSPSDVPVQLPGNAPTITSQLSRAWHNITSGVAGILGHQQTATEPESSGASNGQGATLPGAN